MEKTGKPIKYHNNKTIMIKGIGFAINFQNLYLKSLNIIIKFKYFQNNKYTYQ